MANQLLPWSYRDLSSSELSAFLAALQALTTARPSQVLELSALLNTMLWTGASLDQAVSLYVLVDETPEPDCDLALRIGNVPGSDTSIVAEWRVRVLGRITANRISRMMFQTIVEQTGDPDPVTCDAFTGMAYIDNITCIAGGRDRRSGCQPQGHPGTCSRCADRTDSRARHHYKPPSGGLVYLNSEETTKIAPDPSLLTREIQAIPTGL